ncbi:hypothetical protein ACROYT_G036918 [Oculina patagonica]
MAVRQEDARKKPSSPNGKAFSSAGKSGDEEIVEHLRRFSSVSQEDFEKMRLAEKEDEFFAIRKATDITEPDTKGDPCPPLPIKIIHGSFRHVLGVREACSKNGTFLQRTLELKRKPGETLGFYIRQGDGWEREQGIFVSRVVLGTDVDVFELLRVGDEIIRVNKVDVRTMTIQDVSALMQMTRRLILTVKVLTPVTAMAAKRLAMNKDNNFQGLKALSPRTSRPSRAEGSIDSASNSSRQTPPDRRISNDRRLSNTSGPSHQANYKVANLVIGKNRDAMNSGNPQTLTPSGSSYRGSRRSSKSPVAGRRALSPIRETSADLFNHDADDRMSAHDRERTSRAASVVSWSDQFYSESGASSPVKHKPSDRRRSEAQSFRPK